MELSVPVVKMEMSFKPQEDGMISDSRIPPRDSQPFLYCIIP
jgi:hypothetical protein